MVRMVFIWEFYFSNFSYEGGGGGGGLSRFVSADWLIQL